MADDPTQFTADLLEGKRGTVAERALVDPGGDGARSPEQVLAGVGQSLDRLEALRASEPARALELVRSLLQDPALTEDQLTSFIAVWREATRDPAGFAAEIERPPSRGLVEGGLGERRLDDWWDALRGYVHQPEVPSAQETAALASLKGRYRLPSHPLAPPVNPHERTFETLDPAWVPLLDGALGERQWPTGLAIMRRHSPERTFVYPATERDGATPLSADQAHTVALFSDFGTGYYHSWGIAEQLAAWGLLYSFHLGDVYYAGKPDEFRGRFELPLADVVERTRLFGLAENHELYGGGQPYYDYFDGLRARGRTPQEASYFCVRFPHHQLIAIDANWQGRRRYPRSDFRLHQWLQARLAEADGRTNILLTGNAPFDHGDAVERPLVDDLRPYLNGGAIGLWFWGDDHYAALYDRRPPEVPYYGSCIGHGGFPGPRQRQKRKTFKTEPLWLEDQPRFPVSTGLRDDMSNNGWCQMTLRPDGGVDLLYVDWLWCKRAAARFDRDGAALRLASLEDIDRDGAPQLHVPPAPAP